MKDFFKKHYKWLVLVLLVLTIRLFSANAQRVESLYSNGFYPIFSKVLRFLFGWLPFSFGDILYALAVIWLIRAVVKGIVLMIKRKASWRGFGKGLIRSVLIAGSIYCIFNIFWGINYNRKGIARQLQLAQDSFNFADLKVINQLLVEKVNAAKQYQADHQLDYPDNSRLFEEVAEAYDEAARKYSFLNYHPASLKSSMWGWLGNYTGFTGYYNPFTGEAQVNTTGPRFVLPFTCCHEVAHQLGYAKENEANFVGYLAAMSSRDTLFQYSVYLDLFQYANRTLALSAFVEQGDTVVARSYRNQLIPAIKDDLKTLREFQARHRNPVSPIVSKGYAFYLRNNQQPHGIKSYDEVTEFLLMYYRKFGRI